MTIEGLPLWTISDRLHTPFLISSCAPDRLRRLSVEADEGPSHVFCVAESDRLGPAGVPRSGWLAVNLSCALMLTRFRRHSGSLTKAAFLSARNDALANVAIIVAGLVTAYTLSTWPDLIMGLGIAVLNADAAREVWHAARKEHRVAEP
jgi:hypothetical protein